MRVLIVIYNLSLGGIFTFARNLVSELNKHNKIEAALYVYIPESVVINKTLIQQSKIPVYTAYSNRTAILFFNFCFRIAKIIYPKYDIRSRTLSYFLKRTIEKLKIDILHSNYQHCDAACLNIAQKINKKTVITDHGSYRMRQLSSTQIDLMRKVANNANALIALTNQTEENFLNHNLIFTPKLIFKKIYNGVDLTRKPISTFKHKSIQKNDFIFGMLARGIKEKGWEIAIEAFKILQAKKPNENIKLILTGEGKYLRDLSIKHEQQTNILFTGASNHPLDIIQCYNIALFPSYLNVESMPYSIIEYLQCGKPVIATDIGSIKDMLSADNNLAGELMTLDELNAENLAKKMSSFLRDTKLVEEKSALAIKAVKKFDAVESSKSYLDVYESIL